MANGRQISQRKQVRSALERIDTLEQDVPRIFQAVNEALTQSNQRMSQLGKVLEAVVELFGSETVDAKIKEIDTRNVQAQADGARAALEAGVADGTLVSALDINDKSLIVGREIDADGNVVFPGRVQLMFSGIRPEFQEKLLLQGPGFVVETQNGGKFEVLEVYNVVEKAPVVEEPAATAAVEQLNEELTPPTAEA